MTKKIIFFGGIHGVGKSTICNKLACELKIPHYSASDLIQTARHNLFTKRKTVADVENNQSVLLEALKNLEDNYCFLLDGHFALFDENNEVTLVPIETFRSIAPVAICILTCDVNTSLERLAIRDGIQHEVAAYEALNISEQTHARAVAKLLNVPILFHKTSNDMVELTKFISSHLE